MVTREEFRDYLLRFLFIPYRWGGSNPLEGLDCSGAEQLWLDYLLIDPPGDQSADGLFRYFLRQGNAERVTEPDLGTLLFFGTPERVTHVATALDNRRMIEAGGGDSSTLTPEDAARKGAYVRVSRIARRRDLVAMLRPPLPW